jgi:hypothetical protein
VPFFVRRLLDLFRFHMAECCTLCQKHGPAPRLCRVEVQPGWTVDAVDWDRCRCGRNWGVCNGVHGDEATSALLTAVDPTTQENLARGLRALALALPAAMATGVPRTRVARVHLAGDLRAPGGVHAAFLSYDDE